MVMDASSVTPIEPARLLLVQLLSPAFPTGAFAYAQGLEWAMDQGTVYDAANLREWIGDVLDFGAGWSEATAITRPSSGYSGGLPAAARYTSSLATG